MKNIKEIFDNTNKKCIFIPKTHEYFYIKNDNKKVPLTSVTTWLSELFFKETGEKFNAPKIAKQVSENPNSEYFGLEPTKILSLWSKHAARGTRKHNQIEKWLKGEISEIKESRWLLLNNFTPQNTFSEIRLYSPRFGLSGTADLLEYKKNENTIYIHDFKTVKNMTEQKLYEYSFQILTYCILLKIMFKQYNCDIKVRPGYLIHIEPKNSIAVEKFGNENEMDGFFEPVKYKIDADKDIMKLLKKHLKIRERENENE